VDDDFGSAVGVIAGGDGAVVAARDGFDDGQAESGAAGGAGRVRAGEPVEGVWKECGGSPGPWSRIRMATTAVSTG
jgi:hypothetical protein